MVMTPSRYTMCLKYIAFVQYIYTSIRTHLLFNVHILILTNTVDGHYIQTYVLLVIIVVPKKTLLSNFRLQIGLA